MEIIISMGVLSLVAGVIYGLYMAIWGVEDEYR